MIDTLGIVDGQPRDRERGNHEPEYIGTSDPERHADQDLRNETGKRVHDGYDRGNEPARELAFGLREDERTAGSDRG